MKLIFSGGGKGEKTKDIDQLFLKLINGNKVLFIPHAREEDEFEDSLKWVKNNIFSDQDTPNIEILKKLNNKSIESLKDIKGIFIGGGNTFKLLNELKKSKFDLVLKQFVKNGGIIYGGSAGAIILTKNITTAYPLDKNKINLKNLEGLNLFKDKGIFCHYEEKFNKEIKEMSNNLNMDILCFPEGSGLCINEDKMRIIGSEKAILISGEQMKTLEVGEIVN